MESGLRLVGLFFHPGENIVHHTNTWVMGQKSQK